SIETPGWFASGLSLTAALFGWIMLREPARAARTHSRVFGFDQVREAARDSRIGTLLVLSFLFIVSFSGFESFFVWFGITKFPAIFHMPVGIEQPTFEQTLQAAPVAGRYLAGIGIISALIQGVLIRRLVKRFGETALAVVGPLVLAVGFVVVGLATTWPLVIVGCLIMPLGFGVNHPSLSSLISRATPESEQGAFMALN